MQLWEHMRSNCRYLVRPSRPSLVLFMLSQLYGGPCSPPQEPGPGGGQPDILFLWLKHRGRESQRLIITCDQTFVFWFKEHNEIKSRSRLSSDVNPSDRKRFHFCLRDFGETRTTVLNLGKSVPNRCETERTELSLSTCKLTFSHI